MDGFVVFAIIVFVVIPVLKNVLGAKPAKKSTKSRARSAPAQKNWAQVQELLQQKIQEQSSKQSNRQASGKRDAHGHTAARRNTHQRMHSRDGNKEVFPESHQARVRKRDTRDRSERNRIEAMLHSEKNRSIERVGNNGVDGWGERGDSSSGNGFLFLIIFGLIAFFVLAKIAPDLWSEIMRALNIK